MTVAIVLFYAFAFLAVTGGLGMVLNFRNTVAAAMSLVVTMVALAGIYVLMGAHLIAAFQIMVWRFRLSARRAADSVKQPAGIARLEISGHGLLQQSDHRLAFVGEDANVALGLGQVQSEPQRLQGIFLPAAICQV